MDLHDARVGDAVELPEGIYSLAALTQCRAAGLQWIVWELAADAGEGGAVEGPASSRPAVTLALIQSRTEGFSPAWGVYRAKLDETETLPAEPELTLDEITYRFAGQGEARGERASKDGTRDFWMGRYRRYEAGARTLIFVDIHGRVQRLSAEKMDEQLVRTYQ